MRRIITTGSRGRRGCRLGRVGRAVFCATVPRPAGEAEALRGAIRECWKEEQAAWDRRPEGPHRHTVAPDRFEKLDRLAQNRSLGWPEYHALPWQPRRRDPMPEAPVGEIQLHLMEPEVYLLALARKFEELRPRVEAMRAEMKARPEEFGEFSGEKHARHFDLDLWDDCEPGPETLGELARGVERGLASFICWVGTAGRSTHDFHRKNALGSFHLWSRRSLAAFSVWARNPWFCDVRGQQERED